MLVALKFYGSTVLILQLYDSTVLRLQLKPNLGKEPTRDVVTEGTKEKIGKKREKRRKKKEKRKREKR